MSETKTNFKNELKSAASLILTFFLPILPHYQNHQNVPKKSEHRPPLSSVVIWGNFRAIWGDLGTFWDGLGNFGVTLDNGSDGRLLGDGDGEGVMESEEE